MPSIQEMLASRRAELAAKPIEHGGTQVEHGGTQVGTSSQEPVQAVAPVQAKPTASSILAQFKAAQAAKAVQLVAAATPVQAVKPREYPVPYGTADFESEHPELCEATRKLADELEAEQDGIRYWLDRVHEQLRQQPELVHMLTDDQASALYAGIIARSQMTIVPEKAKAKPKAKAAKVQLSDEDM